MEESPKRQIQLLSEFITERRMEQFEKVLEFRTRYIAVVLEDIYQSQNASAVMRSCECSGSMPLEKFDLNKGKLAMFFGTELTGLTDSLQEQADEYLRVPIYGFTESYNISVAAAIILHYLTMKLHSSGLNWKLSDQKRDEVMLQWLHNSIKHLRGRSQEHLTQY